MNRPLVLATTNNGKLREFARLLGTRFASYRSLKDVGLPAPDETGKTYAANAKLKSVACFNATGQPALADDSGLEVAALDGAPGLHSARYADDTERRIERVLEQLHAREKTHARDRAGRFVCVLAYTDERGTKTFRGVVDGEILDERRGAGGFGYDPIFLVKKLGRTMAELTGEEKDRLSHRGQALAKFVRWLDERGA